MQIDSQRLWASLQEINRIGATPAGGVRRLALSEEDVAARRLFMRWCEAAGCRIAVDQVGNLFARRPGTDAGADPVAMGSHLDTQPTGGRFDGIYGVLAGLEVIRTLDDRSIQTRHPVEVVVWTNEEGARFYPPMMGSGAWAGAFSCGEVLGKQATDTGERLGDLLERTGFAGAMPLGSNRLDSYFELHIEQGPVLENAGAQIGVVSGVQGIRWYDVAIIGREAHAGPTPMELRADPVPALADLALALRGIAAAHGPHGRATLATLQSWPNSRSTVPGLVRFAVDLRHPAGDELERMAAAFRDHAARAGLAHGVRVDITEAWHSPPVPFAPDCVAAVSEAASAAGYPAMGMFSGAGHDAAYVARVAPTAMVFIPCAGGVSHNESEDIAFEDAARGCDVLYRSVLQRACGRRPSGFGHVPTSLPAKESVR